MSGHTPGPWASNGEVRPVQENDTTTHLLFAGEVLPDLASGGKYRGPVCSVQSCDHIGGINRTEAEANLRLIAAAPELLEALTNVRDNMRRGVTGKQARDAWAAANAAIARATTTPGD